MRNNLINSIHADLIQLTNTKISKKEIEKYFIPIFEYINLSHKKKFLISGSQGIGKSTFLRILKKNNKKYYNKNILCLSLDDFYMNKSERKLLAKKIHPLFITRGVPGTHRIQKLLETIKKFENSLYPINVPTFNKIKDTINYKERTIKKNCDILILEGWCCGCTQLDKNYLYKNINYLEKHYDSKNIWRDFYNNKLNNEYAGLFKKFDATIYFKAYTFSNVYKWRLKQEKNNIKSFIGTAHSMNKYEIKNFIQHYEKITKWMMKTMPKFADINLNVDKNQKIKKISIS
tara:strand:+ start:71 stop:937 length:867 start_codon:yes stop_codon:yes gene_type:complete